MNFIFHYMYDTDETFYGTEPISHAGQFNWLNRFEGLTNRHADLTLLAIF